MDLDAPATATELATIIEQDIYPWADRYLSTPSAEAFAAWLADDLEGQADPGITVYQVFLAAYREWTGHTLPDPATAPKCFVDGHLAAEGTCDWAEERVEPDSGRWLRQRCRTHDRGVLLLDTHQP